MRICICSNDELITEEIKSYILRYYEENNMYGRQPDCFLNGEALLCDTQNKDLVFLDNALPQKEAVFVGQQLIKTNHNAIIFIITSYAQHLYNAMFFPEFLYLLKPLDKQALYRCLKKIFAQYHTRAIKIPIETKQGVYTISSSSIVAIEAVEKKGIVHTTSQNYESVSTIEYWETYLPSNCFFRTHRSFIVNFEHVASFDHLIIYMDTKSCHAYLTRRKYSIFKEAYFNYLQSIQ